jgi:hypothetical protein
MKMKLIIVLTSFTFAGCNGNTTPNPNNAVTRDTTIDVSAKPNLMDAMQQSVQEGVDMEVYEIMRNKSKYKKEEKELPRRTAEGGLLTKYLDKDELKCIEVIYFGETGRKTETWYLKDKLLIQVEFCEEHYNSPEDRSIKSQKKNVFYFHDSQIILWVDEDANPVNGDKQKKQEEILSNYADLIEL